MEKIGQKEKALRERRGDQPGATEEKRQNFLQQILSTFRCLFVLCSFPLLPLLRPVKTTPHRGRRAGTDNSSEAVPPPPLNGVFPVFRQRLFSSLCLFRFFSRHFPLFRSGQKASHLVDLTVGVEQLRTTTKSRSLSGAGEAGSSAVRSMNRRRSVSLPSRKGAQAEKQERCFSSSTIGGLVCS